MFETSSKLLQQSSTTSPSTVAYQLELPQTPSITIELASTSSSLMTVSTNNINKNIAGSVDVIDGVLINNETNGGGPSPTQVPTSRSWVH
ncbi:hypothetical protein DERF_004181 [Dermatophagoides farinae]|uniref:Uncharacterized protein n=1 Tax=Dermatophagoides farinae TaxID=6954 RepID=A0A922I6S5_DERFA|nr:hypothetical protein DERF_004181 [Dermatophagoides farinae]